MRRFPVAAHQPPDVPRILSDQARVDMESTIYPVTNWCTTRSPRNVTRQPAIRPVW
jgi:hypothetical protein